MLLVNVFVVGLSTMALEMSAFRLLAPSFGTTQLLITNVIGTIMIALSLGYWLGGRLGDRYPTPRGIHWLVTGAAVLTAAIPSFSSTMFVESKLSNQRKMSTGKRLPEWFTVP